ncbi:MAG: asparagine--tRNA ligase [Candidatus Diapherotrites archaeon]
MKGGKFISVQEAINKKTGKVAIRGWVYRERGSNAMKFIVLRDSSNIIQCVVKKDKAGGKLWAEAEKLLIESSVEVEGTLKADERAPTGVELDVEALEVVNLAEPYPITKDQSTEFLMDKRHLWLRSRHLTAVMKIRSTMVGAIHKFFRERGYYEFDPPILQPNQCEGGSTLFEVKYYKEKTYLTQSWQLYAEAAIFALEKVYDVGPTFRAERSKTSRHLSEFWMAEMEAAWVELPELIQIAKDEIRFILEEVLEHNRAELELLGRDVKKLEKAAKSEFPTITYTDALKILKEKEHKNVPWGKDLRTIEEDLIMKHFDTPVAVTNYPKEIMAFYKKRDPKDAKTALCFDMLAPEGYGEIIGGSQRDTDIKELEKALKAQGEDPANYEWYLDLRRYGSVPHSGYGVGVERVLAWICGLENIKDAIPFPRTMARWKP